MTVPTPEMIEAALKAFIASVNEPMMIKCDGCDGKGYHHGFGEDGASPDWCLKCGGNQYDVVPGEEERAIEAALTAALALLPGRSAPSIGSTPRIGLATEQGSQTMKPSTSDDESTWEPINAKSTSEIAKPTPKSQMGPS